MCNPVFSIFRVGRGPCTRHEAHGRRARPLRDFVARAPTSRSACGGALQNEKRENSVQVNLTLFSLSRFAERTRFELVVR